MYKKDAFPQNPSVFVQPLEVKLVEPTMTFYFGILRQNSENWVTVQTVLDQSA